MTECRCQTEAADYRKKCRSLTFLWHSGIYMWFFNIIARITPSAAVHGRAGRIPFYRQHYERAGCIHFRSQLYGLAGCIPFNSQQYARDIHFYSQQYGCAGCIHFHNQQNGRAGCIPFHSQQYIDVQGVSLSTTNTMDKQGETLSTARSMDIRTCSVQGVCLSTASSTRSAGCTVSPSISSSSVADPGSGGFLTPRSGIRNRFIQGPGSLIPASKLILLRA